MKVKHERMFKIGLGIGAASTLVGLLAYQAGKLSKVNNMHYPDSVFDKIEDGFEHVIYTFKKEK